MKTNINVFCLTVAVAIAACVKPVTDENAVAPNYDRWQATVAKSPAAVFDVTMRVLTDSSYRIASAQKDAGLIRTEARKESDVQRGTQAMKTQMTSDWPVRLNVLISPIGADSSRITISGDYKLSTVDDPLVINARVGEWKFVSGIGQAILAEIR